MSARSLKLTLPWPPALNRQYRVFRNRSILSAVAREYRATIVAMYNGVTPLKGRLAVTITANPPDNRRRDLDGLLKGTLDALQHAGIYLDDAQIDYILIRRGIKSPPGNLEVEIDGYSSN